METRQEQLDLLKRLSERGYHIEKDGSICGPTGRINGWVGKPSGNALRMTGEFNGGKKLLYRSFTVRVSDKFKKVPVHQLQAYQKFGEELLGKEVRHLNGDSLDNGWDNICIGTSQQNALDRRAEHRQAHAQHAANQKKKWSDEQVRALRERRGRGAQVVFLAKLEGVSKGQMSMMLSGKTYGSVT